MKSKQIRTLKNNTFNKAAHSCIRGIMYSINPKKALEVRSLDAIEYIHTITKNWICDDGGRIKVSNSAYLRGALPDNAEPLPSGYVNGQGNLIEPVDPKLMPVAIGSLSDGLIIFYELRIFAIITDNQQEIYYLK